MRGLPLLPLLLPLLLAAPVPAGGDCLCIWGGSFSEVQDQADLVVAATVTGGKGNSVDIAVDQLLRGEEHRTQVRVWMNPGNLCRPEPETFPPGSQWVMALHRIEQAQPADFNPHTPNLSAGRSGDYRLSSCGGYWLDRQDNLVTGNLIDATRWDRNPPMSPVLLELVAAFVQGQIDQATLRRAAGIDPALQQLEIETRMLLRKQRRSSDLEQAQ